jgi:hypothetical protein
MAELNGCALSIEKARMEFTPKTSSSCGPPGELEKLGVIRIGILLGTIWPGPLNFIREV